MDAAFEATREAIWEKRRNQGLLIGAHRGTSGGSIVQNTIPAFSNALLHGADVVEIDAIMSTDGDFFAFHDGEEKQVFGVQKDIRKMSSAEILSYPLINSLCQPMNNWRLNRLDDVLEALKGRCLINIDRSWFYWKEVIACLNRHNMFDQIILKAHVDPELLETLVQTGPNLMYMPIVRNQQDYLAEMQTVWKYPVNVLAAEVIMVDPVSEQSCRPLLEELHKRKIMAWINALTLSDGVTLSMWRDDNKAIIDGPEGSWGWLMDLGYDIIQTDWPALLNEYVRKRRNG